MEKYKCPGCQREELHVSCPAYGTPFYMTGTPLDTSPKELLELMASDDEKVSMAAQKVLANALCVPLYAPFLEQIKPPSGDVIESITYYGEEKIWNPKPEKG